eukprot:15433421-Alexandrium_andersonii.AAC.1
MVAIGGMRTLTARFGKSVRPLDICLDCRSGEHPSLDHVQWECEGYSRFRALERPSCHFAARVGWGVAAVSYTHLTLPTICSV